MEETQQANQIGQDAFAAWKIEIEKNAYSCDKDFIHSIKYYFPKNFTHLNAELENFGNQVSTQLEELVQENNLASNLPSLDAYNATDERTDKVVHHPTYRAAGDIIYSSRLMEKMSKPGGLLECLSLFFLSSQAGEAGHNCPIACSAGIIRVLQKIPDFPNKTFYLQKLTAPSYSSNFTGAQFLTEIQGGSDVGLNAVYAKQDKNKAWRLYGEKWFCSNAGAELIFITARYDEQTSGTKGLGLFLVPAEWNEQKNHYMLRRLKDKIGTRSLATAEIDLHGAYAIPMGPLEEGFHLVMDNVLHLSRIFNTVSVLGIARRAYWIARAYAVHRVAFSHPIIDYPLVKENLAQIKVENTAMLAAIFATVNLQDKIDLENGADKNLKLLLRLLVNVQKYLSALWSVEHVHHALDVFAGNGTIETFSPIPRLLRDAIVCENWEGTHNVLRMQVLKDILKYNIDQIYLDYMQSELTELAKHSQYVESLILKLNKLSDDFAAFRKLDSEIQTLQIKPLVDRIGILYCAAMLLKEAIAQQSTEDSSSKADCFEYFSMLHVTKKEITYDHHYLKLITRIVENDNTNASGHHLAAHI